MIRRFVLLTLICAMTAGRAAALDDSSCASIADDRERLACYDRLHAPHADTPTGAELPKTGAGASFGSASLPVKSKDDEPSKLQAHVVGRITAWRRGTLFKLDNGQVWQSIDDQNDNDGVDLLDPQVTIERNFIGHYWMSFGRMARDILVTRVQ